MLKNTVMDEDFHVSCDQAEVSDSLIMMRWLLLSMAELSNVAICTVLMLQTLLAEFIKYDQTPVSHVRSSILELTFGLLKAEHM
jgi:hypothetical protein